MNTFCKLYARDIVLKLEEIAPKIEEERRTNWKTLSIAMIQVIKLRLLIKYNYI